ncbi:MAG TPA: hypothetical protein VFO07_08310 [Roseiflexaceae bacterium]|nr:hypothetical protein [Roseiflexaceae bacterium]
MKTTNEPTFAARRVAWLRRIAPALGVFFLAPLTAEYLIGYDTSTGDFGALLFGLIFFGPLYGGAALIIREVTRRAGRGWLTMILLAFGFGVLQPALIDHSLFNPSYRDIEYWQDQLGPTYIAGLGIGAEPALNFIVGHAIWSICAPIAIVETLVPYRRTTPWLGVLGLTIIVVLYILVSALFFLDHVEHEQFLPSAPQLLGAAAVVVTLIMAAFVAGRRPRPTLERLAPNPWLVGALAFAALNPLYIVEVTLALLAVESSFVVDWRGVALNTGLLAALAILVVRWSRRVGWGAAHRLALAGGALLTRVWLAFFVEPLGEVALYEKLVHNTVFAIGALVLLGAAARAATATGSGNDKTLDDATPAVR